jgi:hypothetical protein
MVVIVGDVAGVVVLDQAALAMTATCIITMP